MVQAVTIPENFPFPALTSTKSRPKTLIYLTKILHGSAYSLIIIYFIAYFIVKPLLARKYASHSDLLKFVRSRARDTLIFCMEKVKELPLVAIRRNGKLYSESIQQTNDSALSLQIEDKEDILKLDQVTDRLKKLRDSLKGAEKYDTIGSELKPFGYQLKEFSNYLDMLYYSDIFSAGGGGVKKFSSLGEVKKDIRSIKGLFMSGQI